MRFDVEEVNAAVCVEYYTGREGHNAALGGGKVFNDQGKADVILEVNTWPVVQY